MKVHINVRKCSNSSGSVGKKQVISLLSLLPYYNPEPSLNPSWNDGDNIQPAMELAKDQINNSSTVLDNYTLCLIYAEAGCNQVGRTTVSFVMHGGIGEFKPKDKVVGIIGPGCSASTLGLAPLTNRSDVGLVMVHGSGSPKLEDHDKYRYLLGTLGSTQNFIEGFIYLLRVAKWNRIAILYDDSRPYHLDTEVLLAKRISSYKNLTIEFSSPVSFTNLPLEVIQQSLTRVIYVLCPTELSQRIVCLSYNKSMTYSNYQWVYMSQTLETLSKEIAFFYEGVDYYCTEDDMVRALDRMLLMTYKLVPSSEETLVSNTSYEEYLDYYESYREKHNIKFSPNRPSNYTYWATYIYDAVWAWGLVLDNLTKSKGFKITDLKQTQVLLEQFYNLSFQGMSGEINFDRSTGFSERKVNISQIQNGVEVCVALINGNQSQMLSPHTLISDSFPNISESIVLGSVFNFIILIQLIVNIGLHIITGFNFKQPSIRASSSKMLHISYIGTYVLVTGAVIYSLRSEPSIQPETRCWFTLSVLAWFLPLGFTLAIGPVAMRTWRVYRIFQHYLDPGRLISDPILLLGIGMLLLADVTLGSTWTALDPLSAENVSEFNDAMVKVKSICTCKYYYMWFSLLVFLKLGLVLLVTILALLTRKIPNRSFTTNALRVLAYILSIILTLGFSLHYILRSTFDPNGCYVTILLLLNLIVCVFTLCIFIPPVAPFLKTYCRKLKAKWQADTVDECSLATQTRINNVM